jgi:hypothetical protein
MPCPALAGTRRGQGTGKASRFAAAAHCVPNSAGAAASLTRARGATVVDERPVCGEPLEHAAARMTVKSTGNASGLGLGASDLASRIATGSLSLAPAASASCGPDRRARRAASDRCGPADGVAGHLDAHVKASPEAQGNSGEPPVSRSGERCAARPKEADRVRPRVASGSPGLAGDRGRRDSER